MAETQQRVCLDCSTWSAIFNREAHHDLSSLNVVMDMFDQKKLILIVPTLVICELASSDKPEMATQFSQVLLRSNVEQADITLPIAIAAGELRRAVRHDQSTDGKKNLKTPDAIIVAAASGCNRRSAGLGRELAKSG